MGKIGNLHRRILETFRRYSEVGNSSIDQRASLGGPDSWKKAQARSHVELELLPSVWHVGYRRDNTPTPVVLLMAAQGVWVSWFERWYVEQPKRMRLDTVSLGFWKGPSGSIQQLFRADWDHCDLSDSLGKAQPHWNIDHEIPAFASPAFPTPPAIEPSAAGTGLEELSPQGGEPHDISRYHLCMSALWPPPHQRRWRRPYGGDVEHLLNWLDLALDHVSQEFSGQKGK